MNEPQETVPLLEENSDAPAQSMGLLDHLDAYCGRLRDFCVRRGVMHVTIDSATDLTTLLLDYLRKRGLLK